MRDFCTWQVGRVMIEAAAAVRSVGSCWTLRDPSACLFPVPSWDFRKESFPPLVPTLFASDGAAMICS